MVNADCTICKEDAEKGTILGSDGNPAKGGVDIKNGSLSPRRGFSNDPVAVVE
jgi:hypothetical protein